MLSGLLRLLLYRFLGARVMLGLAVFGWLRRMLGGRRDDGRRRTAGTGTETRSRTGVRGPSAYQPSQGTSQTVQREPR
jgi:hypothetical protein